MIPDPDPAESNEVDYNHPSKLAAAEQMCTVDGVPELYDHNQCGVRVIPDPSDPQKEVNIPKGNEQGELLENDTVII